jgi:hypothetical protein
MNSLEEWPTYTEEQVQQLINQTAFSILSQTVKYLEGKRGYLDNPEGIKELFKFNPVEPKPVAKEGKSLLRRVK